MILDIVKFLLLWFLASIPVGLILGWFLAHQEQAREREFASYVDHLRYTSSYISNNMNAPQLKAAAHLTNNDNEKPDP